MADFPENINSATPAKYIFRLISGDTNIICDPIPLEWESGTLEINRDLEVGGVFSSFQVDSLTFLGNGATLLRSLFEAYELNAECTLKIYYWKSTIMDYVEFPSSYDINFNFYQTVKVGNFVIGVQIKAVNSSIQTKLDNRKDIDVDIKKLITIGEKVITDYHNLKKNINYAATNVNIYAQLAKTGNWDLPRKPGSISFTSIPLNVTSTDYTEVQPVSYITQSAPLYPITPFFKNAKFDYVFEVDYQVAVDVISDNVFDQWEIWLYETKDIGTIQNTVLINEYWLGSFGSEPGFKTFDGLVNVSVAKGNDLKLVIRVANTNSLKATLKNGYVSLKQQIATSPAKITEGYPIYEAFERTCQLTLDSQFPFRSDFFARTDVQKNESGEFYTSENQLSFAHIQSGLNLRGLTLSNDENPLALNFKDLFKTAQSIWNLGYGFELIDGSIKLRIEQYAYFFQNELTLDISGRINKYDIASSVMPELVPISIKSGFENYEYLELNGRAEPNTTNERTTIINTNAKYDNIAPFRGDTKGILTNLATPLDTTDAKSDDKIFIIKTQRNGTDEWKPEKAENIQIVANSLFGEDLLNRYFTPSRMIKRHGNRIKSGFTKLASSYLRFQKSDKLQTLRTTGEGYTLSENENILISDLDAPIYKPMQHTVKCDFNFADLEAINLKPHGYIKFSDNLSGYLLNLKKKNNENKAEITIIEKV